MNTFSALQLILRTISLSSKKHFLEICKSCGLRWLCRITLLVFSIQCCLTLILSYYNTLTLHYTLLVIIQKKFLFVYFSRTLSGANRKTMKFWYAKHDKGIKCLQAPTPTILHTYIKNIYLLYNNIPNMKYMKKKLPFFIIIK